MMMASINRKDSKHVNTTFNGARAVDINKEQELRRAVLACFLWEDQFYENGDSISNRIRNLIPNVSAQKVADIAIEAREQQNLRHVPLLIVREMARLSTHKHLVADTLYRVIQRPDEITEFVAIYWKDGKEPLSAQVKKGLARAFTKFGEYSLAKYSRDGAVKLRDVMFLCHAKPIGAVEKFTKNERKFADKYDLNDQERLWKRLVEGNLATPDTWEVELSSGKVSKKESWTRLLSEGKLGALALLRNLRNMEEANVDHTLIRDALNKANVSKVLPFRFIAASKYAPRYESELEAALFRNVSEMPKLSGHTIILVDVSGSMDGCKVSEKSEMTRRDAAIALAMIAREVCETVDIVAFESKVHPIPPRRGFAIRDALMKLNGGTMLGNAVKYANDQKYDRLIVITDEQSSDSVPAPLNGSKGYMINVASYNRSIGYGDWIRITGFSESIIQYIRNSESLD